MVESKYTDNPNFDEKPEFVGKNGVQHAVKPQDDDKIYKYVNMKSIDDFKKEFKKI